MTNILKINLNNYRIHQLTWIFILLYPSLVHIWGSPATSQKIMHLLFFLILATFVIIRRNLRIHKFIYVVLVYYLFISIYYIFTTLLFTKDITVGDFADFIRPFPYIFYFSFPLLFPIEEEGIEKLEKSFAKVIFFQIIFSTLVYIHFLYPIVDIYKGRLSSDSIIFHFYRWSGTFVYPSDFSFFISFFIYYYVYQISYNKTNSSKMNYVLLVILFIGLLMTISRGGIASVFFMLFIAFLFTKLKFKKTVYKVGIPLLLLLITSGIYLINKEMLNDTIFKVEYITNLFDNKNEIDGSVNHRIRELVLAQEYSTKYFPFGGGANRKELLEQIPVIESLYGYHLIKWGWFGLLLHLFGITYILYIGYKTYHSERFKENHNIKAFLYAAFLLVLSSPLIFGFSSAISDRFKCLPFHYIICGYIFILYQQTKKHTKKISTNEVV